MNSLSLLGLILSLIGVILLYFGFQIEKAERILMSGKSAIRLKYENPLIRRLGWFFLILGFLSQLISEFVVL